MRGPITLSFVLGMLVTGCSFLGDDADESSREARAAAGSGDSAAALDREQGGVRGAISAFVERTYTPFPLDSHVTVTEMRAKGRTLERRLELRERGNQSDTALRERLPAAARRYVCSRDFPRAVIAAGGRVTDRYYRASGGEIGTITVSTAECGDAALPPDTEGSEAGSVFDPATSDPRPKGRSLVAMANAGAPRALSETLFFQRSELNGTRLVRHFRVAPSTEPIDGNLQALLNQDLCASTPYRRFLDAGGVIRHRYTGEQGGPVKSYNLTAADCRGIELGGGGGRSWRRARYETAQELIRDVGVARFVDYLAVIGAPGDPGAEARTRALRGDAGTVVRELVVADAFVPLAATTRQRLDRSVCNSEYLRAVLAAGAAVRQIYFDSRGQRLGAHRVEGGGCASAPDAS